MAGRNFPVVLLVGRNDIFANPACFLMLTSFELVSYFVPSRNHQRGILPPSPLEARESWSERKAVKFAPGKTVNGVSNVRFSCAWIDLYFI